MAAFGRFERHSCEQSLANLFQRFLRKRSCRRFLCHHTAPIAKGCGNLWKLAKRQDRPPLSPATEAFAQQGGKATQKMCPFDGGRWRWMVFQNRASSNFWWFGYDEDNCKNVGGEEHFRVCQIMMLGWGWGWTENWNERTVIAECFQQIDNPNQCFILLISIKGPSINVVAF